MLKLTLSYLAGAFTVAAAVYAAGGRATLASFGLGFFFALVVAVAVLSSARRIKRAARFLLAFAAALDRTGRRSKNTGRPTLATPIRKAEPIREAASAVELDVRSALRNMGMNRKQAEAAARIAAQKAPAGTFEQVFKIALDSRSVAA